MAAIHTHYDNLKVARNAPPEVIRAAYKTLSQKYHPDRYNGDKRASEIMAIINASYDVLSDPVKRRAHDAWIAQQESIASRQSGTSQTQQARSTQPQPSPQRRNSARTTLRHIARYWLLYGIGGFLIWGALQDPQPPPPGPKPYQATPPVENPPQKEAAGACRKIPYSFKDSSGQLIQGVVYSCTHPDGTRTYSRNLPSEYGKANSTTTQAADNTTPVSTMDQSAYVRPSVAPNGTLWPHNASYISGYPQSHSDGLSNVTIDNSQNNSDVFVKLVSLDGDHAYPIRQVFIPRFKSFIVRKVRAGSYDIRYRDLDTGSLSRSEAFSLEETRTSDGVEYSNMTMTLYKVEHGNMQTFPLSESEF